MLEVEFEVYMEVKAFSDEPIHNVDTSFNYTVIQAAIKVPETLDGHSILVEAGVYFENLFVNKPLTLIGGLLKSIIQTDVLNRFPATLSAEVSGCAYYVHDVDLIVVVNVAR